jgi:hypothetical protein
MTEETKQRSSEVPEVTYGRNLNIPAASSALRLCQSPQKGRHMEATRDIKIGQCSSLISVHNNLKIVGHDKMALILTRHEQSHGNWLLNYENGGEFLARLDR